MCIHLSNVKGSISRTALFLVLHFFTAWGVAFMLTGSVELATLDAIIEPIINAAWYFLLDRYVSKNCKVNHNSKS